MEVAPEIAASQDKVETMNSQTINVSVLYATGKPNPEYRELLSGLDDLKLWKEAGDPETFLTQNQEKPVDLVLVDLDGSTSIPRWLENLITRMPQSEVMVCSHSRDPDLLIQIMNLRAGGFLPLPLNRKDFLGTLSRIRAERQKKPDSSQGQILAVAGAKGGVGTTAIATNLAVAMAEFNPGRVILVDLARPFPHVGQYLDLKCIHSIKDLVDSADNLDSIFLKKIVQKHASNLDVLLSTPDYKLESHMVPDLGAMGKIFKALSASYDWVVLDLGAWLDQFYAWMVQLADQVMLVTELDVPNLQDLKMIRTLFQDWGLNDQKVHLIVNRYVKDYSLGLKDLENTFPRANVTTLPSDFAHLINAINQGEPLRDVASRSKLWRRLEGIAGKLMEQGKSESDRQVAARPGLLRRLF
jgi:pilus assembly protein CpaE